jgi:hypothetical protein
MSFLPFLDDFKYARAYIHYYPIHYYPRVTLKTYLPVKRIGNKFLVLPGDNNGYIGSVLTRVNDRN